MEVVANWTVDDGQGGTGSSTLTITITGTNTSPTANAGEDFTATEQVPFDLTTTGLFVDDVDGAAAGDNTSNIQATASIASAVIDDVETLSADGGSEDGEGASVFTVAHSSVGAELEEIVFSYTGALQEWTVPEGITYLEIEAAGGRGGAPSESGNAYDTHPAIWTQGSWTYGETRPGFGGVVKASTTQIAAGQKLFIRVGGAGGNPSFSYPFTGPTGGWNGGGDHYFEDVIYKELVSGAGGGATDIRFGGNDINDRIVVAGGGGGATGVGDRYSSGGDGGGLEAAAGSYRGGKGGTQTNGGAGKTPAYLNTVNPAQDGSKGQ